MSTGKRIAKNTFFLYFRMLFNMCIALYTSRVVLEILGVTDFGLYNLVGGIIGVLAFFNNALSSATQRFINVEKSNSSNGNLNKIFNISMINHVLIAVCIILLGESIGLWALNHKLNIPSDRLHIANIIFQISLFSMVIEVIKIPFHALIIANEKMSFYAYLGVFESVSKLFVVFMLLWNSSFDNLMVYSLSMFAIVLIVFFVYMMYCRIHFFDVVKYRFYKDTEKFSQLLSFSGWTLLGSLAVVCAHQGLSIMLNIFFGVVINAAIGIANQVNSILYGFVSNFQLAFNPQIVQTYAKGEIDRNKKLILMTSKYSFFLLAILTAPFLLFIDDFLQLWLGTVIPNFTNQFVQIVLICSLLDAIAGPFWISANAIGRVKYYYLVMAGVNLFNLPVAYIFLKLGYSPVTAFYIKAIIYLVLLLYRYAFVNKYLKFDAAVFREYIVRITLVFIFLIGLIVFSDFETKYDLLHLLLFSICLECTLFILILSCGFSAHERQHLKGFIGDILKKKLNWSKS